MESKGVRNTHGMNKGGTQRVGEIEVTMVHAIHSCGIQDGKKIVYGGEAAVHRSSSGDYDLSCR